MGKLGSICSTTATSSRTPTILPFLRKPSEPQQIAIFQPFSHFISFCPTSCKKDYAHRSRNLTHRFRAQPAPRDFSSETFWFTRQGLSYACIRYRPRPLGGDDALQAESIAAELDELPLPYRFDVKAYESIKQDSLREHIQSKGINWKSQ